MLEALAGATRRGVEVACALPKDPGDDIKAAFATARVPLKVDASARAGLAIFDRELVWYGSLPLLAFPRKDDCSLRFRSPEAARELTERLNIIQAESREGSVKGRGQELKMHGEH